MFRVCLNSECCPLLICKNWNKTGERGIRIMEWKPLCSSSVTTLWQHLTTFGPFSPLWLFLATFGPFWLLLGPAGCCRLECGLVGANVCAAPALSKGGFHPATTQYHTTSDNAGTSTGTSPGTSLATSCSGIPVAHWYPVGHTGTEQ